MKLIDVTLRESVYYGKGLTNEEGLQYLAMLKKCIPSEALAWTEIGYINNDTEEALNYSADYISATAEICKGHFKMAAMMHPGKADISKWDAETISKLDLVRIVVGQKIKPDLKNYVDYLHNLGVKVSVNFTYVTRACKEDVIAQMQIAKEMGLDYFYCADSSGSMMPAAAAELAKVLLDNAGTMQVGLHLHDHMQMALGNAVMARDAGIGMTDVSVTGAGKGGGNLKLEQAIPVLNGTEYLTYENLAAMRELMVFFNELIDFPSGQSVQMFVDFLTGVYQLKLKEQDQLDNLSKGCLDAYFRNLTELYTPASF